MADRDVSGCMLLWLARGWCRRRRSGSRCWPPIPDFGRAGLPLGAGDLGAWLPGPGDPDGLGDEVGAAPRRFHGKLGEHGAGKLAGSAAGLLAFEHPRGLGEFFQAEGADRVIEQAALGT